MWAQNWEALLPHLIATTSGEPSITDILRQRNVTVRGMAAMAQDFYISLGFPPLPPSFWSRSQFVKPLGKSTVCHASAADLYRDNDVRYFPLCKQNFIFAHLRHFLWLMNLLSPIGHFIDRCHKAQENASVPCRICIGQQMTRDCLFRLTIPELFVYWNGVWVLRRTLGPWDSHFIQENERLRDQPRDQLILIAKTKPWHYSAVGSSVMIRWNSESRSYTSRRLICPQSTDYWTGCVGKQVLP